MASESVFFAYPSQSAQMTDAIRSGISSANRFQKQFEFISWEENDIVGRPVIDPILSNIENSAFLVADITKVNFNVTYEIGYAIGRGKKVLLLKNSSIKSDEMLIRDIGIFDTLGYLTYDTSDQLGVILQKNRELTPIPLVDGLDRKTPVFILETPRPIDSMRRIVSRVKKSRHQYRSFNPSEDVRLSALDAIHNVGRSAGVLVPLLHEEFVDSAIHNIRGAFIAGLAHGMGRVTLILQHASGPVPMDVRDFAKSFFGDNEIKEHVQDFAFEVYGVLSQADEIPPTPEGYLASLSIGDPMAENEFQTLGSYYLRTDEYARTRRGEVNVVVGRKGTGKTALFAQVRDDIRRTKKNIVVDLKPEGFQLLKLKEEVLDLLSEGAKSHLITAFWEYLLLSEVAYKVIEKDQERHIRDHRLNQPYLNLREIYHQVPGATEGDFSERLIDLSSDLVANFRKKFGAAKSQRLSADEITNLLHLGQLGELREALVNYLKMKGEIWILFDNLDKGWSSFGVTKDDIDILRCLLDANRKIQRDIRHNDLDFHSVVFIRNDVYQLLVRYSADFGKEMQAILDWGDADLLREMIRRRIISSDGSRDGGFAHVWATICIPMYDGEETSQYFIDRSLMRPRNLLKIVSYCKGFAVNLGHEKIEEDDIRKGINAYSNDLLIEADRELSDIEPMAEGLIYQFIGEETTFSPEKLSSFLGVHEIELKKHEQVIDYLLFYGFLGVKNASDDVKFIYDVGYNLRILSILISKNAGSVEYILNPAFWPALAMIES